MMVFLLKKLGGSKVSSPIESEHSKEVARLDTSKVPFMAFFRVSTLR